MGYGKWLATERMLGRTAPSLGVRFRVQDAFFDRETVTAEERELLRRVFPGKKQD